MGMPAIIYRQAEAAATAENTFATDACRRAQTISGYEDRRLHAFVEAGRATVPASIFPPTWSCNHIHTIDDAAVRFVQSVGRDSPAVLALVSVLFALT
jgi:hypothetical protein